MTSVDKNMITNNYEYIIQNIRNMKRGIKRHPYSKEGDVYQGSPILSRQEQTLISLKFAKTRSSMLRVSTASTHCLRPKRYVEMHSI
jgi:hypothetical protein